MKPSESPNKSARTLGANQSQNRSFTEDTVRLNIAKLNFESSHKKATFSINNPHLPPMVSPVHDRASRMVEICQQVENSSVFSHENFDDLNANQTRPQYKHDLHKSKQILQNLFKALQRKEEKLGFSVLKLIDLILEKNIPRLCEYLFLESVQKFVITSI